MYSIFKKSFLNVLKVGNKPELLVYYLLIFNVFF